MLLGTGLLFLLKHEMIKLSQQSLPIGLAISQSKVLQNTKYSTDNFSEKNTVNL
jgi:hypothetical protein